MSGRMMKRAVREALRGNRRAVRDYRSVMRAGAAKCLGVGVAVAAAGLLVVGLFCGDSFFSAARGVLAVSGLAALGLFVFVVKPETDCLFFWMLKGDGAIGPPRNGVRPSSSPSEAGR